MRPLAVLAIGIIMCLAGPARAAEAADVDLLEVRATQALTQGDYERALPVLEKLAEAFADQPQRRERVEEQIRLARRNVQREAEDARRREVELAAQDRMLDALLGPPPQPPQTAEQRKAHAPPVAGEVRELTLRQLGNFEYDDEAGGNVPEDVRRLSGSRIRVSGFMIPLEQATRVRRFILVADLFACCFGQPPRVHHAIEVTAPAGRPVDYTPHEIVVEGVLKVQERFEDGWVMNLFELEASSVRPAPR